MKRSSKIALIVGVLSLGLVITANATIMFTFTSASGGSQTLLSASGSSIATDNTRSIEDFSLPFDFVTSGTTIIFSPTTLSLTGSVNGVMGGLTGFIANSVSGDDLQLRFQPPFTIGETLTASGSTLINSPFSNFISGGSATFPFGAPFDIVIGTSIPEPGTIALMGLGLAGLLGFGRCQRRR